MTIVRKDISPGDLLVLSTPSKAYLSPTSDYGSIEKVKEPCLIISSDVDIYDVGGRDEEVWCVQCLISKGVYWVQFDPKDDTVIKWTK